MNITTALLQAGDAGVKLSTELYTIATGSINIDQDLANLASDVALTSTALINVGNHLTAKEGPTIASKNAHGDAQGILRRCQESFDELRALTEVRSNNSKLNRFRMWPQRAHGTGTVLLQKKMEVLKTSLILFLSILKFHHESPTQPRDRKEIQQQAQSIQQLYHHHRATLTDIRQLQHQSDIAAEDTGLYITYNPYMTMSPNLLAAEIGVLRRKIAQVQRLANPFTLAIETLSQGLDLVNSYEAMQAMDQQVRERIEKFMLAMESIRASQPQPGKSASPPRTWQTHGEYARTVEDLFTGPLVRCKSPVESPAKSIVFSANSTMMEPEQNHLDLENFDFDSFLHEPNDHAPASQMQFRDIDHENTATEDDTQASADCKLTRKRALSTDLARESRRRKMGLAAQDHEQLTQQTGVSRSSEAVSGPDHHSELEATRDCQVLPENCTPLGTSSVTPYSQSNHAPQSNHALDDYWEQYRLLEEQRKKRLDPARLAQDRIDVPGERSYNPTASNLTTGPVSKENIAAVMGSEDWLFSGAEYLGEETDVVDMLLKRWTVQV